MKNFLIILLISTMALSQSCKKDNTIKPKDTNTSTTGVTPVDTTTDNIIIGGYNEKDLLDFETMVNISVKRDKLGKAIGEYKLTVNGVTVNDSTYVIKDFIKYDTTYVIKLSLKGVVIKIKNVTLRLKKSVNFSYTTLNLQNNNTLNLGEGTIKFEYKDDDYYLVPTNMTFRKISDTVILDNIGISDIYKLYISTNDEPKIKAIGNAKCVFKTKEGKYGIINITDRNGDSNPEIRLKIIIQK
jgi:hypothetical protein